MLDLRQVYFNDEPGESFDLSRHSGIRFARSVSIVGNLGATLNLSPYCQWKTGDLDGCYGRGLTERNEGQQGDQGDLYVRDPFREGLETAIEE